MTCFGDGANALFDWLGRLTLDRRFKEIVLRTMQQS
jgi:hypothetical protein